MILDTLAKGARRRARVLQERLMKTSMIFPSREISGQKA